MNTTHHANSVGHGPRTGLYSALPAPGPSTLAALALQRVVMPVEPVTPSAASKLPAAKKSTECTLIAYVPFVGKAEAGRVSVTVAGGPQALPATLNGVDGEPVTSTVEPPLGVTA